MPFFEKLKESILKNNSLLCVGLDTDITRIPEFLLAPFRTETGDANPNPILAFNQQIINATSPFASAYKINSAFYEAYGELGFDTLRETKKCIPSYIPVILDAKRGDIGNSSKMYAKAVFEVLDFDAITVNPYPGFDGVEPFLQYEDKGVFVLCLTSNPGADDFQTVGAIPLYIKVAKAVAQWNKKKNCGLVVGATKNELLKEVRKTAPDLPWLVPGVGTQGGSVEQVIKYGGENLIINSSRAIIYAGKEADFAVKAGESARRLKDEINRYRRNI